LLRGRRLIESIVSQIVLVGGDEQTNPLGCVRMRAAGCLVPTAA
jgi:hypothetical protein